MTGFLPPLVSFDTIERDELNACLVAWGHQMGPLHRPEFTRPIDFAVRRNGKPVAVIASDTLIRPTCGLGRGDAFELSRLCADPDAEADCSCSTAMRLWRDFGYPSIVRAWRTPWVISYQDAARHRGTLYRYDHWRVLGHSVSGSDPRARGDTAKVRRKVIWGWTSDRAAFAARAALPLETPAWAKEAA